MSQETKTVTDTQQSDSRVHQPGQAAFRSILSEDVEWKPFPAFPPSVRLAVMVGHPSERGPYMVRVKVPHGVRLMPHKHPEDRIYTVISGVFYIGLGDKFDRVSWRNIHPVRDNSPGRHATFPLGEIRRVHNPSDGDRSAWA